MAQCLLPRLLLPGVPVNFAVDRHGGLEQEVGEAAEDDEGNADEKETEALLVLCPPLGVKRRALPGQAVDLATVLARLERAEDEEGDAENAHDDHRDGHEIEPRLFPGSEADPVERDAVDVARSEHGNQHDQRQRPHQGMVGNLQVLEVEADLLVAERPERQIPRLGEAQPPEERTGQEEVHH